MLADLPAIPQPDTLSRKLHEIDTFLYAIIDFIADELPRWRDDADRPSATSETTLTSQLRAHLNSRKRHYSGIDTIQFGTEDPDAYHPGRKIDLTPAPCDAIVIHGRRYTKYDMLLPIECKRLPTPKGTERDEREYVFSQFSTTGGIQRFKAGHHGSTYQLGAMIGYVQTEEANFWHKRILSWISELADIGEAGWTESDHLSFRNQDITQQISMLDSVHTRANGLADITLRHLWLQMS